MHEGVLMERIRALEQALGELRSELDACRTSARRTAHDLGERVKEVTCLYAISSLMQHSVPQREIMEGVANSLVPAYQYPEVTGACIRLPGVSFSTPGFRQTPWMQAATLTLDGQPVGAVEVCYGEERPTEAEGPFLLEERHLIDTVAAILVRHLMRARVEEALRQSELKHRLLVENLYEGIWLVDHDFNTTFVNGRAAQLLGYEVGDMLGKSMFAFMDSGYQETVRQYLARDLPGIHESRFLRKDGSPIWTRVATKPLFDEQGRYQGALAGIVDISERKRAEAALTESEARYRRQAAELAAIYWSAPIGLAVLDAELRFVHVNRRLAEINGVSAESHIGKTLQEIVPGIAAQGERVNRRTMETGEPSLNVEFYAKSPAQTGTGRCWNTQWLALKDDAGKVWGVNVVVDEVTERKHFEENLYRREQEFEALAERSPDVIARINRHGRFLYANPAVETVTGERRGSFIGRGLDTLRLSPVEEAQRRQAVREVFERAEERILEHTHQTPAGDRQFQSRLVPEFDRDGTVESVLIVDRDITELKRMQEALEQMTLHDPLTGVANRRYLDQFIEREWRHEARHRHTVAMVMADIDHFKAYNDRYGHPRGDECLRQVAHALRARLRRPADLLVRYGGEEFVVVLPETGVAEARQMAEAMRLAVEQSDVALAESTDGFPVTISLGVSAAPARSHSFSELLASADQALYRAKQRGRNRVEGVGL
jgi:diguanylate cyclase (GGDEF)-like protein/PAS domain S-box-containing protein